MSADNVSSTAIPSHEPPPKAGVPHTSQPFRDVWDVNSPAAVALTIPTDNQPELCPHFGTCGGCQLQHLPYPTQLALKEQTLRDTLIHAGLNALPPIQTHAANPWYYRNRIRLRLEPASEPNTFLFGYNRPASNTLLPIHACPIAAPILLRAAHALTSLTHTDPEAARWLAPTAELELFTLPDESRLQLTLLLRTPPQIPSAQHPRSFTQLCERLQQHIPELAGAAAELLRATHAKSTTPRASRRAAATFTAPTWGSPGLLYPVDLGGQTHQIWVSRGSFFQINRHLVATLVSLAATSFAESQKRSSLAWDLFSGVGLFSRALAPHFARVTAVESSPIATADLAAARLPNLHLATGTVLDFLRIAALDRDRPAFVLLDPPRAGLGPEAAELLVRLAPPRIVYISCNPITLARDLNTMLSSGYNLAELHLVDMFPQTIHLETVAILNRA